MLITRLKRISNRRSRSNGSFKNTRCEISALRFLQRDDAKYVSVWESVRCLDATAWITNYITNCTRIFRRGKSDRVARDPHITMREMALRCLRATSRSRGDSASTKDVARRKQQLQGHVQSRYHFETLWTFSNIHFSCKEPRRQSSRQFVPHLSLMALDAGKSRDTTWVKRTDAKRRAVD